MIQIQKKIPYKNPVESLLHFRKKGFPLALFEFKTQSIIGMDPVLKISGKDNHFCVEQLTERGAPFFQDLAQEIKLSALCDEIKMEGNTFQGRVEKNKNSFEESDRARQKNSAQIIRKTLEKFATNEEGLLGLYGAFSYDFIRLFEDLEESLPSNTTDDFELFLFDTFLSYDTAKKEGKIVVFRPSKAEAKKAQTALLSKLKEAPSNPEAYKVGKPKFQLSQSEYESLVQVAKEYAKKGEIFEVVFSNKLKADFEGDPLALYLAYREKNPSPYQFFLDTGSEQLLGASPEMMVRVQNRKVTLRPISGTAQRGKDPLEDHENMMELLNDSKERAELDMLIDLGRNDLSRVCKPGLQLKDYRFIEKYAKVMHTVAEVTGDLQDNSSGFDALIAVLNAGTLTGAPKVAAMNLIEKHEKERRGFYGGVVGYLTFSGEVNTAIIIRSAHIKDKALSFQVGATLLHRSNPSKEYQETLHKAEAFLNTLNTQKI